MRKSILKTIALIAGLSLLLAVAGLGVAVWSMPRRIAATLEQWYDPGSYPYLLERRWPRTRSLLRLAGRRAEACRLGAAMTAAAHPWLYLDSDMPPPLWRELVLRTAADAAEDCRRVSDDLADRRCLLVQGYQSAWNGDGPAAQRLFGQARRQAKEATDDVGELDAALALARWQDIFGVATAAGEAFRQVHESAQLRMPGRELASAAVWFEECAMYTHDGQPQQAMTACLQSLQLIERRYDEDNPKLAFLHEYLAGVYSRTERVDLAEQHYRKAMKMLAELPAGEAELAWVELGLGRTLLRRGDVAGGLPRLRTAADVFRRSGDAARPRLVSALSELAAGYRLAGQNEPAQDAYREALALSESLYPTDSQRLADLYRALGEVLSALNDPESATLLRQADELQQRQSSTAVAP